MSRPNFVMALRNARRHFLDRWHEDETVPGRWGRVARSGETTYRSAMLAARRRPSSTLPRPECGKASTYEGGCRCIPCTTAATERNSARRRVRKGATARRFLGDADRARIVELRSRASPSTRSWRRRVGPAPPSTTSAAPPASEASYDWAGAFRGRRRSPCRKRPSPFRSVSAGQRYWLSTIRKPRGAIVFSAGGCCRQERY